MIKSLSERSSPIKAGKVFRCEWFRLGLFIYFLNFLKFLCNTYYIVFYSIGESSLLFATFYFILGK